MTTLIEIINDVLRATKSHGVSDWQDTDESRSVAYIVRRQTAALIKLYPQSTKLEKLRELPGLSDTAQPTSFTKPTEVEEIYWIKYKTDGKYKEVCYMEPYDFIHRADMGDLTQSYLQSVVINSVEVPIFNDRLPKYWTTFDNSVIVMDAFDSTVDSTLMTSKTQMYVREKYTFTFSNTYEIPLDEPLVSILTEECISSAYVEFKGSMNPKAEQQARRGRILEKSNQDKPSWTAYSR
jgi:hypothetical protein